MSDSESASRATVQLPHQRFASRPPAVPAERLRFGPGVPAAASVVAAAAAPAPKPARRPRTARVISGSVSAGIVAFVVWFLWPAGPLHVRGLSVRAVPAAVSCGKAADVVATVLTNGNPGTLHYRWDRGDGRHSNVLRQSLRRGQRTVALHLSWRFDGLGAYSATATVRLLEPEASRATVRFTYRCGG